MAIEVIGIRDAIDMHVHSSPSIYPRVGDDWSIACACRDAGMRAIVLKSHHESTVSRAALINQRLLAQDPETCFEVLGGICLNTYVGGINPRAVEVALWQGGRIVWMPTIEAAYHGEIFGGLGGLIEGMQVEPTADFSGIAVSHSGQLTPQVVEVITLVAAHGAVLAAGHVSQEEALLLAEECAARGAEFIVNHPFFFPRVKDVEYYRALTDLGAYLELCANICFPAWPYSNYEENLQLIEQVGDDRCFFSSDGGNVFSPWPHEALRVYLQNLHRLGLSAERIYRLSTLNPARILDIEV